MLLSHELHGTHCIALGTGHMQGTFVYCATVRYIMLTESYASHIDS